MAAGPCGRTELGALDGHLGDVRQIAAQCDDDSIIDNTGRKVGHARVEIVDVEGRAPLPRTDKLPVPTY
jgi:hypothetical protein